jgi:hypothetical protein
MARGWQGTSGMGQAHPAGVNCCAATSASWWFATAQHTKGQADLEGGCQTNSTTHGLSCASVLGAHLLLESHARCIVEHTRGTGACTALAPAMTGWLAGWLATCCPAVLPACTTSVGCLVCATAVSVTVVVCATAATQRRQLAALQILVAGRAPACCRACAGWRSGVDRHLVPRRHRSLRCVTAPHVDGERVWCPRLAAVCVWGGGVCAPTRLIMQGGVCVRGASPILGVCAWGCVV